MDRRRAAGALLALAACIASSHAAPTATSNHTALDLVDELSEGCYYNFQHYGEGDRIMTNEPCLNCTCHNRMLMCYLRVCPFTKAIGQDCTVEKRADQCCPIVTCPDVPVDLLTSTSTSSPAEYGGTGIGKVDKYGCSINGKYFPEGAKVPPTPNKPCEHCYCIRNMTTCVMQECTLHVDGCTPIYHKDVCCPVRYFCDHPEDEIPLLDDMTTTVRPTPGFLLTTIPPTEEPETTTLPVRRDCIEDDQLYPDGALIKTEKPCEHCYCMKGDIVCVVQECGTPMENEGKNCTSLPPREGQCCPDTYICEGDEVGTEPSTVSPFEEIITTTQPSRRVSVEGSGYRNEDEITYTEVPSFATELEGSGEDEMTETPVKETIEGDLTDKFGPTDENEFIPKTTPFSIVEESEKVTTEPDKGLNTVPSEDEDIIKPSVPEQTTSRIEEPLTEPIQKTDLTSTPIVFTESEEVTSKPVKSEEETLDEVVKTTEPTKKEEHTTLKDKFEKESESSTPAEDLTTPTIDIIKESQEPTIEETTPQDKTTSELPIEQEKEILKPVDSTAKPTDVPEQQQEERTTETHITTEKEYVKPHVSETTESPFMETSAPTESSEITEAVTEKEQQTEKEATKPSDEITTSSEVPQTTMLVTDKHEDISEVSETRRTSPTDEDTTTLKVVQEEQTTEVSLAGITSSQEKMDVTEPSASEQNTVPISAVEEQSSEPNILEKTTEREEQQSTSVTEKEINITIEETTTPKNDILVTVKSDSEETTLEPQEVQSSSTVGTIVKEELTTVMPAADIHAETISPEDQISESRLTTKTPFDQSVTFELTTLQTDIEDQTTETKESTTEGIKELSTFAHVTEKESVTTESVEHETVPSVIQKEEFPETTTINLADNEIAEPSLPGRIPGEGDCLLEGITYQNNSDVPSSNKCHSGCKCLSSIIKCDPIICSLPPEDMENCQPRYDTPDACCPNYVCDQGMETIPPQPQSHITETETSTLPPAIECSDDQCQVSQKIPSQPQPTDRVGPEECNGKDCKMPSQSTVVCKDDSCSSTPISPEQIPVEIPTQEGQHIDVPPKVVPQSCNDPENCKDQVPTSCDGTSCSSEVKDQLCNQETGCIEPEISPPKIIPELCGIEGECKPAKEPEPGVHVTVTEACTSGDCKNIGTGLEPVQPEVCSDESGCKKPMEPIECNDGKCTEKDLGTKFGCSGNECMQQEPIPPSEESAHAGPVSTEIPAMEETTSSQPLETSSLSGQTTRLPDSLSTLIDEETTPEISSEQNTEKPEKVTTQFSPDEITSKIPELTTEQTLYESTDMEHKPIASETEIPPEQTTDSESHVTLSTEFTTQKEIEISPSEEKTEKPALFEPSKEPEKPSTDEKESTTMKSEIDITAPQQTTLPETLVTEEISVVTDEPKPEREQTTTAPKSPYSEKSEEAITEDFIPKYTEEAQVPEGSDRTEPVYIVTEPELHKKETAKPEIFETTDEPVTKSEESVTSTPTKSIEMSTSSSETFAEEEVKTKEPIELTTQEPHVLSTEKQTVPPGRAGYEPSTTTPEVIESVTEIKLPEPTKTDEIQEMTETPIQPPQIDESKTERAPISTDDTSQSYGTEITTTKADTVTPSVESQSPAASEKPEVESSTTISVSTQVYDEGKETESPLSLVTKEAENITTAAPASETDDTRTATPESLTVKPEDKTTVPETYEPPLVTQLPVGVISESETPLSVVPDKITSTEKTLELGTEKATEQQSEVTPVTEKQEAYPETPGLPGTEPTNASGIEELPEITTTSSSIHEDTELPVSQEKSTGLPQEELVTTEKSKPLEEKEKVEEEKKTTPETTTSQLVVMNTEEPEKETEQPGPSTVYPTKQETETELPESSRPNIPFETTEKQQKEETTKEPITEVTVPKTEKEQSQTEIPVPITESTNVPPSEESTEKALTESPEQEQELTEKPEEYVTQPVSYETSPQEDKVDEEQLTTHEPQKSSTEPTSDEFTTKLPEFKYTEHPRPIQEEGESTISPQPPQEELQTEAPEAFTTEISELGTTEKTYLQTSPATRITEDEQKVTDESISAATEPIETSSIEAMEPITEEHTVTDQKPVEPDDADMPKVTDKSDAITTTAVPILQEEENVPEVPAQTSEPELGTETTPFLVELEEHTHKIDEEEPAILSSEAPSITYPTEQQTPEQETTEEIPVGDEKLTPESESQKPLTTVEDTSLTTQKPHAVTSPSEIPEKSTESSLLDKFGSEDEEKEIVTSTVKDIVTEQQQTTPIPVSQTEKEEPAQPEKDTTSKPTDVPVETTAPEEEFIPVTSKATTVKSEEEAVTQTPDSKPEEKPSEGLTSTSHPETPKPEELLPTDEVPSPEEEAQFPPSGGYNQETEPDYVEEDQAFGPGTCRYGGKVYVSAQQIPRDDPCDFCFCFRSDIICLQQSCPPPIHGCHEEPIQGFCCPRYECPVSMATTLNVTTTTTTTTTTLPPHFLPHAYKGAAQRRGCQIKGHTYQVGEVVRASSGPCLHCTCGGDGQMKCDPKACTPEPMLRQMIAAAVSAKRRR